MKTIHHLIDVVYNIFQVARHPEAVTVVTGIVGCAGLKVRSGVLYCIIFLYCIIHYQFSQNIYKFS